MTNDYKLRLDSPNPSPNQLQQQLTTHKDWFWLQIEGWLLQLTNDYKLRLHNPNPNPNQLQLQ